MGTHLLKFCLGPGMRFSDGRLPQLVHCCEDVIEKAEFCYEDSKDQMYIAMQLFMYL